MKKVTSFLLVFSIAYFFTACSKSMNKNGANGGVNHATVATGPGSIDVNTVAAQGNPAVTLAITPAKGSLAGGYSVLLIGTGFIPATTVKVGGNSCSALHILSASQISCTMPASTTEGAVDIVTTTGGASTTFPAAFIYANDAFSSLSLIAGTLDPSGSANGVGNAARFNGAQGMTSDGTNLYVVDTANQVIRAIQISSGQVSILAGTIGVAGNMDAIGQMARFYNPQSIAWDYGQNLYVTDGNQTIRQINLITQLVTTIAGTYGAVGSTDSPTGPGTAARFSRPNGIVTDGSPSTPAGNLYVTDYNNQTVRQISLAPSANFAVTTIAGVVGTAGNTDGNGVFGATPSVALFRGPYNLAMSGTMLYVADWSNYRIRQIDLSPLPAAPAVVSTLAGSTNGFMDGPGIAKAKFYCVNHLWVSSGFLYLTDYYNSVVRKVNIQAGANYGMVSSIAGSFPGIMNGSADGIGAMSRFTNPNGIAVVGGQAYVADGNQSIRQIDLATNTVTTFAGVAVPSGYLDGSGLQARFTVPKGGAVYNGNLYVTDSGTYTIRQINLANGNVSTLAGTPLIAGTTDGTEFNGRLANPYGITADPASGNLYVSELNHVIRKVDSVTGSISTILGTPGVAGTVDGTGQAAQFNQPFGIVYGNGFLYIADTFNHAIRMVNLQTMAVTTLAGLAGTAGTLDGVGSVARFYYPRGIALDQAMTNLYVADTSNHAIRQINIASGKVTTFAGVLGGASYSDGVGNIARFYNPWGMTGDGKNLYVYDNTWCLVRKVNLQTAAVTTMVGNPSAVACNDIDGTLDVARTAHPFGMHWSPQGMFLFGNHGVRLLK